MRIQRMKVVTGDPLFAPAFSMVFLSVLILCPSASHAMTLPLFPIKAAKCIVLFPGAAQASMTVQEGLGFSACAGMQLAFPCAPKNPT